MATKSNPLEWMNEDDYAAFNAKRFERDHALDPDLAQFAQDEKDYTAELQADVNLQVDRTAASVDFDEFVKGDIADIAQVNARELEEGLLARTPDEIPLDERVEMAPRMFDFASQQAAGRAKQEFGLTATGLQQAVPGATTQELGPQAAPLEPGGEPPSPGDVLGFTANMIAASLNLGSEQTERVVGILADTGFGRGVRAGARTAGIISERISGESEFSRRLRIDATEDPDKRWTTGPVEMPDTKEDLPYYRRPLPSASDQELFQLEPDISEDVAKVQAQIESRAPGVVDKLLKDIGHSYFANQQAKLDSFRDTLELIEDTQAWEMSALGDPSLHGEWNEKLNPNWAGKTLQDIADVRAARFEYGLQDITDKHGIAWAEILGNVFLDPLNLVGFGLLGKVPLAGKVLGPLERLYVKAASKPFELAGKGITKTVGLGTKTRIDRAIAKVSSQTETYFTGKNQLLTDDVNATEELVRLVTGRTGAKLPSEFDDIQRVFDADVHNALPELLKGLTPAEAVERISQYHRANVQALIESTGLDVSKLSDKGLDAMGREIPAEKIRSQEQLIDGLLEQQGMIRQVLKAVPKPNWAKRPISAVGKGARTLNDTAIDPLHRGINLPFARAQLIFAAYAPFNYLETLAFAMLSGAKPGLIAEDVYDLLRQVDAVIPAIGGKRGPAVGVSRQTAIDEIRRGDPISRFFQKIYEHLDGTIDGGLRRNTAVQHIEQGINSDAVLREAAENIRKEIYNMLPESLRNEAHNMAQAAAIWGLRRPKSLPQLADQFLLPKIKERAARGLVLDYASKANLPPEALQAAVDYTSGKIRTIDGLRARIDSILEGRVVDKAIGDLPVMADMVKHLDGMADRALAEGGEYLKDFLTAHRYVRIQLDQSHRRLMATQNQIADIARAEHNWQKLDEIWRVKEPLHLEEIRATQLKFQEQWDAVVAKDPSLAKHPLASEAIDGKIGRITTKYSDLDRVILQPVREAASLTKGQKAKGAAWDDYFRQRREFWAKRDKEIDELIAKDYPEFEALITGKQAAPPGFGTLQAKFGQVSVEMRSQANNLIADVEGLNSLKAAPEHVKQLRQGLEDLAETLPETHMDHMAHVISEAAQRTQKTFINYPGNSLDAVARVADPFWIYQSRRLPRIAEQAVRHPGMYNLYEDYFVDTERGYLTSDAFGRYQWDLTRGSILSLIAAGRRRGNIIDLEALMRGEPTNVIRGDRFPERYEGFFGTVEKAQELLSGLGIYAGGVIELGISLARGIGSEKEGQGGFLETAELGNLIPPPVSLAVNALEIAGVDTTGFHTILRDSFHDRAVKLAKVEIWQQRHMQGLPRLDEAELTKQARKKAAIDELVGTQVGALRVRSPEEIQRQDVSDKVMAERRGITQREYKEQRTSPGHEPPDALDRMAVDEAWGRMLNGTPLDGAELRQMISSANRELRPLELRQLGEEIEKKRDILKGVTEKWQPIWDRALGELQTKGFITQANIDGTIITYPTFSELYRNYWKEVQTAEVMFADVLPKTSKDWDQVAAQYGTAAPVRSALDSALRLLRDITPDNDQFKLPLTDETDWDSYFKAREDFLSNLDPDVRAHIDALTMQRDVTSNLPLRQEMRLAGRLRRQMYEQPKYFYFKHTANAINGDPIHAKEASVFSDDVQAKLETLENKLARMTPGLGVEASRQTLNAERAWKAAGGVGARPFVTPDDVARQQLLTDLETGVDNPFQTRLTTGATRVVIADAEELRQLLGFLDAYKTARSKAGGITKPQTTQGGDLIPAFMRDRSPRKAFLTEANRNHKFPGTEVGLLAVVYEGQPIRRGG